MEDRKGLADAAIHVPVLHKLKVATLKKPRYVYPGRLIGSG